MIYDFHDYLQRPLSITDNIAESDSPYIFPQSILSVIRKADIAVHEKSHDKHLEKKLKKWIEEYPQVPPLKILLAIYYLQKDNQQKAFECSVYMVHKHPDYLLGAVNLIDDYLEQGAIQKVEEMWGDSPDIFSVTANRKIFLFHEYADVHKTIIRYWLAIGKTEHLLSIFNNLTELETVINNDLGLDETDNLLCEAGLKEREDDKDDEGLGNEAFTEDDENAYVRTEPTLPQTTTPPAFHFPQIQWLYQNGFSIEKEKLEELLQLPREPLIQDLVQVVYDTIRRHQYFSPDEYTPPIHSFPLHALFLLMELQATEALPAVLEMLRQPPALLDYWFSDLLTEDLWQVIYDTGQTQLPTLQAFLQEPHNYAYARTVVSTAISQVALHQPHRRQEIVALYNQLLQFYFQNQHDPTVFNRTTVSFIMGDIMDFKGKELTDTMKPFYEKDLIALYINGTWQKVVAEMNDTSTIKDNYRKRELTNLFKIRDYLYESEMRLYYGANNNSSKPSKPTPLSQPFVHTQPKTGRNDPCPCSSGKKYKKCCGKGE